MDINVLMVIVQKGKQPLVSIETTENRLNLIKITFKNISK